MLLIDADLRKPQAHEHFGVLQAPGLSDVTEALFERIAEDDLLHVPLGDRRLVLVEFPYLMPAPRGIDALAALARAGCQPVLAHAERYLQAELDSWLERIARHGTWMQCNIGSLAGLYGAGPRALANDLLERGLPVLGAPTCTARNRSSATSPRGWSASADSGGSIPCSTRWRRPMRERRWKRFAEERA